MKQFHIIPNYEERDTPKMVYLFLICFLNEENTFRFQK